MRILLIVLSLVALGAWTYPATDPYYSNNNSEPNSGDNSSSNGRSSSG
jgi:hypothetical protein